VIESVVNFLIGAGLGVYFAILFSVDPFGIICRANEKQNDSLQSDLKKERSENRRLERDILALKERHEQDIVALKKRLADAENVVRAVRKAVQTEAVFRPWDPKSNADPKGPMVEIGVFTDNTFAQVGS